MRIHAWVVMALLVACGDGGGKATGTVSSKYGKAEPKSCKASKSGDVITVKVPLSDGTRVRMIRTEGKGWSYEYQNKDVTLGLDEACSSRSSQLQFTAADGVKVKGELELDGCPGELKIRLQLDC